MLAIDADLMQSVLVNLVDNAIKASAKGQKVILAAYDNMLEVRDHGIGMEQECKKPADHEKDSDLLYCKFLYFKCLHPIMMKCALSISV